jgi:predicted AAA+ superfamily ATPase
LARTVGESRGYRYLSFDDADTLTLATNDPVGFVSRLPEKCILDEVQKAPEIFSSLKFEIDRRRKPGRYILSGSANVLLVPRLSDSLAGRMGILHLHPLSQSEIEGTSSRFLDVLFRAGFKSGLSDRLGGDLARRIVRGGYPAAVARRASARRRHWYRDYVETQIRRDIRDLSRIRSLDTMPKLLEMAAARTGQILNVADLGVPLELTRPTIHEHVALLERVFLIERLPSWHRNPTSRLVKRPKLHICDTGVACELLGLDPARLDADRPVFGSMLETFVLQELRRQADARPDPSRFSHFRDRDGYEVDIVLEHGFSRVAGVEVKSASTVNAADFRGLRKLREAAGEHFVAGVVVYDGGATIAFGDRMFAVPVRKLWEQA